MIDVSDGLAADADHLARAGGVEIEIEIERLPLAPGLVSSDRTEEQARLLAASGGEDYELLACLPSERASEAADAVRESGCPLTEIGEVLEGDGVRIRDRSGAALEIIGYDHLRSPRRG